MADRAGFEVFYRANLSRIVRACTLVMLDPAEAEDVAAEAFARLWSHWNQISTDDHAGGYVFKTAMRLCWRRKRRASRELIDVQVDRAQRGDASERREVFDALGRLSLRQRQAVVLRDWAGFETGEVAEQLGIRESTVRVHLARGREALRRSLGAGEELEQ